MDKLTQTFPDPAQFTEDKQFMYAALTASVFKKVIAELLNFVDQQPKIVEHLRKKDKGEIKDNFGIGRK